MRAAAVLLALLGACGGLLPPDKSVQPPVDLAVVDGDAPIDMASRMDAATASRDMARPADLARATDLAQCGNPGDPCCDISGTVYTECSDPRAGSECAGTCAGETTCLRNFGAEAYGVPTCYACGGLGQRCCYGTNTWCNGTMQCKPADGGAFNNTCQVL